jgi:ectoine hydroxylase-related dioxygenase (phytanoyl-CoA dioxygenase family)
MFERNLSPEEIASYRDAGVAHVQGAISPEWTQRMYDKISAQMTGLGAFSGDTSPGSATGRFVHDRYMWPSDPDFRAYAFESGVAKLCAQAMESRAARLYFDQIFVKEPETHERFFWHQDLPYWPMGGTQICSAWVTMTDVDAEASALEFVLGSDKLGKLYRPVMPEGLERDESVQFINSDIDQPEIPDFDADRPKYNIVSFDMKAGDALIFNTRIVHSSRGNASKTQRRLALSTRWLGDDAAWKPRPGADPIVAQEHVSIQPGELCSGDPERFPLVYSA